MLLSVPSDRAAAAGPGGGADPRATAPRRRLTGDRDPGTEEVGAELAPRLWREARGFPWAPTVVGGVLLLLAVAVLVLLRGVLTPFLLAALLGYLVAPMVERLHRHTGLPRTVCILAAYAALGAALAAFVAFVLPDLIGELQRLGAVLPAVTASAQNAVARLRAGYGRLPLPADLRTAIDGALMGIDLGIMAAVRQTLGGAVGLVGLALSAVLAPVMAYYLLADLPRIKLELARLLPPGARQPVFACLADLDAVLAGWVRGQLLIAAAVGALATTALLILGVRFAFTLGLVAGLGELVPYFGPVLGALPAVAVAAAAGGSRLAVETALAFLLIQQLESVLLAPRIVGGSVGLHPLAVITALLVGEHLGGLVGVILSVPVTACLRVLGRHVVRALTGVRRPRRLA